MASIISGRKMNVLTRNIGVVMKEGMLGLRAAAFHSKKRGVKPDPPIYNKSRVKRMPMTTKRANKNFYKGNGCRTEGHRTHKGGFILNPEMVTELVVPDLTHFKLKPYIATGIKKHVRDAVVNTAI